MATTPTPLATSDGEKTVIGSPIGSMHIIAGVTSGA